MTIDDILVEHSKVAHLESLGPVNQLVLENANLFAGFSLSSDHQRPEYDDAVMAMWLGQVIRGRAGRVSSWSMRGMPLVILRRREPNPSSTAPTGTRVAITAFWALMRM